MDKVLNFESLLVRLGDDVELVNEILKKRSPDQGIDKKYSVDILTSVSIVNRISRRGKHDGNQQ